MISEGRRKGSSLTFCCLYSPLGGRAGEDRGEGGLKPVTFLPSANTCLPCHLLKQQLLLYWAFWAWSRASVARKKRAGITKMRVPLAGCCLYHRAVASNMRHQSCRKKQEGRKKAT